MFKTPEEGCQTIVYCAVADGIKEHSGRLFENCRVVKMNADIADIEACRKLWRTSLQLCGLEGHEHVDIDCKDDTKSSKEDEDGSQQGCESRNRKTKEVHVGKVSS